MSLIYEPKGKAREYSPLAMNIFNGCDHGCTYCYVPACTFRPGANKIPLTRKNVLFDLEKELKRSVPTSQILLCFLCDPYPLHDTQTAITRSALEIFSKYLCKVAILSKGGRRALRDLDIIRRFPAGSIKFGSTLTFFDDKRRLEMEPGAASVSERLDTLAEMHSAGIKTFASIEPVIDPIESLKIIAASLPHVDQYKIGKINHDVKLEKAIDWPLFLSRALSLTRGYKKQIYIKEDLRKSAPGIVLSAAETDADSLTL